MNGKFLLDTNIVIAFFAEDSAVKNHLEKADEIFLPSIVLGELYFGARKSHHTEKNVEKIEEFAKSISILGCDAETAKEYGVIKNMLRRKGQPIPENDIWIAAIAKQHGLPLVTKDSHFGQIEGCKVETW